MVLTRELFIDLPQLIAPPDATICARIKKSKAPLTASIRYSLANLFLINGPAIVSSQSLSQNMAKLTISSRPQQATKPILIIEGNGGQQIYEISVVTIIGQVYEQEILL